MRYRAAHVFPEFCRRGDLRNPLNKPLLPWLVKYLPAMQETWVRSLAWEEPLEEGMATHSSILAWRIPVDKET